MTTQAETVLPPIHINSPSSTRFVCRVRMRGCRRWRVLPGNSKQLPRAINRLARVFASGKYKRGEVLVTADYYEPTTIMEMVKR